MTQQISVDDRSYQKRFADSLFGWCFNYFSWLNYFSCNRPHELTKIAEISCAEKQIPTQAFSTNRGVLSSNFAARLYVQLGSCPLHLERSEISGHRIWAFLYFKSHEIISYLTFLCLFHKQWPINQHSSASHGNEWSTREETYSTRLANRLCPPRGSTPHPSPRPAQPVPCQTENPSFPKTKPAVFHSNMLK